MRTNVSFGVCGLLIGKAVTQMGLFRAVSAGLNAQAPSASSQHCDLTVLVDGGQPGIGKEGEIKYDDKWSKVVNDGWILRTTTGEVYMFEKCR